MSVCEKYITFNVLVALKLKFYVRYCSSQTETTFALYHVISISQAGIFKIFYKNHYSLFVFLIQLIIHQRKISEES
jgi:hypothetical protein